MSLFPLFKGLIYCLRFNGYDNSDEQTIPMYNHINILSSNSKMPTINKNCNTPAFFATQLWQK